MTRRTWWHHSFYPPSLLVPGSNALRCRGQRFQIKFDLINLRRLYFLLYWFVLVLFCVFYIWPFLVFVLCCGLLCSTLKPWRETKESVFINVSLERSTLTVSLFLLLFDWHSKTNVSACFSGLKNKSKFISFSTTVIYKDPFFFGSFWGFLFNISHDFSVKLTVVWQMSEPLDYKPQAENFYRPTLWLYFTLMCGLLDIMGIVIDSYYDYKYCSLYYYWAFSHCWMVKTVRTL